MSSFWNDAAPIHLLAFIASQVALDPRVFEEYGQTFSIVKHIVDPARFYCLHWPLPVRDVMVFEFARHCYTDFRWAEVARVWDIHFSIGHL